MTNKKFKLAAMSLATAVAVSTVGPSASAVTYYLGDGSELLAKMRIAVHSVIRIKRTVVNRTSPTSTRMKWIKVRSTSRTATSQRK